MVELIDTFYLTIYFLSDYTKQDQEYDQLAFTEELKQSFKKTQSNNLETTNMIIE